MQRKNAMYLRNEERQGKENDEKYWKPGHSPSTILTRVARRSSTTQRH